MLSRLPHATMATAFLIVCCLSAVWCKCNDTASDVIPWPLPKYEQWNDFQSRITLYYLHASRQMFGPIPKNPKVRGDNYYRGMA